MSLNCQKVIQLLSLWNGYPPIAYLGQSVGNQSNCAFSDLEITVDSMNVFFPCLLVFVLFLILPSFSFGKGGDTQTVILRWPCN